MIGGCLATEGVEKEFDRWRSSEEVQLLKEFERGSAARGV